MNEDKPKQLKRLSKLQLRTEDDVREEFITPLLRLLGYDHARGEIIRGKSLSMPFMSGTGRKEYIVPDYLTKFEDVVHFAIDAKKPGISFEQSEAIVMDQDHIGQVFSYAAHREVQAPLFVISNGHLTAVYETSNTDYHPVLLVRQDAIETRFEDLGRMLSKKSICKLLSHRLPLAWKVPIHYREVGFQPINLDVGDINLDGFPEIAIALSENHIPIVNHRGEQVATIETDGWVWWVKCTHATESDEATLIAIQKHSGSLSPMGKVLGIQGSNLLWQHPLPRAGSGFEELNRIVIDPSRGFFVFGVPCDNVVSCLTFKGEELWSTRITNETALRSVMHVQGFLSGNSVLVTSGKQDTGIIAELDILDGALRQVVDLPFRGAQIEFLDSSNRMLMVADADAAQVAIVDWKSGQLISVIELPFSTRNLKLAIDCKRQLIAISGINNLRCYDVCRIDTELPTPIWQTDKVAGYISRLLWIETSQGSRLLASTCGSGVSPQQNGIYLLDHTGVVNSTYHLSSETKAKPKSAKAGPAGIRDVKATSLSSSNSLDLVAISDDSQLYVWSPS